MGRTLVYCALLPIAFAAIGCATIISGKTETVEIASEPPGQSIKVDGVRYETPAKVSLSRHTEHYVEFPNGEQVLIEGKLDPWVIANFPMFGLLGGALGLGVDLASGAASGNLEPDGLVYRDGSVYAGTQVVEPHRPSD